MARHLMRYAGELYRLGRVRKDTLAMDLNAELRRRWPDVQLREIENAALKFMQLADAMTTAAQPANSD